MTSSNSRASALIVAILVAVCADIATANDEGMPFGSAAEAPGNPSDERPDPDCPKEDDPPSTDPVYLDTGEFYLSRSDLTTPEPVIPVRGELAIDLRRSYRSNHTYNGLLGYGWDFRFNRRLRQLDDGNLVLTSGICSSSEYAYNGSGWDPPPGVFATLVLNPDATYTQTFPSGRTHRFDADGNYIEYADRHGNRITMTYSSAKEPIHGVSEYFTDATTRVLTMEYRLEKIIDTANPAASPPREIVFTYDPADGRLETFTDWAGRTWTYDHDPLGNLITVTSPPIADHPAGTTTEYIYDDIRYPHKVTKVIPPTGYATGTPRLVNTYDDKGRVDFQILQNGTPADPNPVLVDLDYDVANSTTTITDANGTQRIYVFEDGQIKSMTWVTRGVRSPADEPAASYTTSYTLNENKQRTITVYPEGNSLELVYNPNAPLFERGNLLAVRSHPKPGSGESVLETVYTYKTPFQQLGTITDPRNNVTEFFYDASFNLERIQYPTVVNPLTSATEGTPEEFYTINEFGQVTDKTLRLTSAAGDTTTAHLEFDDNGYLERIRRAYGTALETSTEYDPDTLGRPTIFRDGEGREASFQYNAWSRIERAVQDPSGLALISDFHFDENGNLVHVERDSDLPGDRNDTLYTYNLRDWLVSRTNERNEQVELGYDANGNRNEIKDAEDNPTQVLYDERNLPFTRTDAEGRVVTFHYHENATLHRVLDGEGRETRYDYDGHDRLETTTYEATSSHPVTTEIRGYDSNGNLTTWTSRAGDLFSFSYDELNRRRARTTPADAATFDYDLAGRLTGAANSSASWIYAYNERHELVSETVAVPGLPPLQLQHTYDLAGNLRTITYPDTTKFEYLYDDLNRVADLLDGGASLLEHRTYDEFSRMRTRDHSNGLVDTFNYDEAHRIEEIHLGAGGSIESLIYERDPTGAISTRSDASGIHTYGYDATKQLTGVDYPALSMFEDIVDIDYDDAGNRDGVESPAGTTTDYAPNALNQYDAIQGISYQYDENGNLTSDGGNSYTFDAENRLSSGSFDDGGGGSIVASYAYDPFMRRISKTVDGTTTHFLWSRNTLVGEYDAAGNCTRRYVYFGGYAPAIVEDPNGSGGSDRYRVHFDHLATPRHLTDASGTVVWAAEIEAFGGTVIDNDPDGDLDRIDFHLRFPGQYEDTESGLHYNRSRYYSPSMARYVSADPIGQLGGLNLHTYSSNSPMIGIDPLGLDEVRVQFNASNTGGTITYYDDNYDVVASDTFSSGWGQNAADQTVPNQGRTPAGPYSITQAPETVYQPDENGVGGPSNWTSYCDPSENCFFIPLVPNFTPPNGRCPTEPGSGRCGVHPNGGGPGTSGCVGLNANDTTPMREAIEAYNPSPENPLPVTVLDPPVPGPSTRFGPVLVP